MSQSDEKLEAIRAQLKKGVAPQKETVRSFLLWFGAERRGYRVVRQIRYRLKKFGLATSPDFEYSYIDGYIGFVHAPSEEDSKATEVGTTAADPTYRLARLESANKPPVSVKPDATLEQAITLMLTSDFSQLPVMTTLRDVKGVVSWKTIGSRLALKRPCAAVRDRMEPAHLVSIEDSMFSAIAAITAHDYVLVQGRDKSICGIITASDLNVQFLRLAEPFLIVGEIENGIRRILHGKFTSKELEEAKGPGDDGRTIEGVADLTFGEYIRLIESEKRWKKLNLAVDRAEFVSRLNKIREVRNDVMHFDPDGLEPSDMELLREFAQFLKRLRDVGAV
ncbi:MAG: CBS domain-containing protein [Nitrospiraceae bacterium]|nr:MAG: CBS domain-containing protein [Nitrospiraceae bacterium]